jgi:hypothetical protein
VLHLLVKNGKERKGCKTWHTDLGYALLFVGLFLGHMWLHNRLKNFGESFGSIFFHKMLV